MLRRKRGVFGMVHSRAARLTGKQFLSFLSLWELHDGAVVSTLTKQLQSPGSNPHCLCGVCTFSQCMCRNFCFQWHTRLMGSFLIRRLWSLGNECWSASSPNRSWADCSGPKTLKEIQRAQEMDGRMDRWTDGPLLWNQTVLVYHVHLKKPAAAKCCRKTDNFLIVGWDENVPFSWSVRCKVNNCKWTRQMIKPVHFWVNRGTLHSFLWFFFTLVMLGLESFRGRDSK